MFDLLNCRVFSPSPVAADVNSSTCFCCCDVDTAGRVCWKSLRNSHTKESLGVFELYSKFRPDVFLGQRMIFRDQSTVSIKRIRCGECKGDGLQKRPQFG